MCISKSPVDDQSAPSKVAGVAALQRTVYDEKNTALVGTSSEAVEQYLGRDAVQMRRHIAQGQRGSRQLVRVGIRAEINRDAQSASIQPSQMQREAVGVARYCVLSVSVHDHAGCQRSVAGAYVRDTGHGRPSQRDVEQQFRTRVDPPAGEYAVVGVEPREPLAQTRCNFTRWRQLGCCGTGVGPPHVVRSGHGLADPSQRCQPPMEEPLPLGLGRPVDGAG